MPVDQLRDSYISRIPALQDMAGELEQLVRGALAGLEPNHVDRVAFRAKAVESFLRKAQKPRPDGAYADPLIDIEDQVGGRVLVFFRRDIESVNLRLHEALRGIEFSRRSPETPDRFGYESDHWICLIPEAYMSPEWRAQERMPRTFELQVRTLFMHAYAEPQHNMSYKTDAPPDLETLRRLAWIAASAWGADNMFEEIWRLLPEDG